MTARMAFPPPAAGVRPLAGLKLVARPGLWHTGKAIARALPKIH